MILCRGNGLLQTCAATRDFKNLKAHIKRGADVNSQNDSGETALYVAAYYGEETMIDVLLQFGADPNHATGEGNTPLHAAAFRNHARVLDRLVAAGGDLRLANLSGRRVREIVGMSRDGESGTGDVVRKAFEACEQLTAGSEAGLKRCPKAAQGLARRLTFRTEDGRRCETITGDAGLRYETLEHLGFGSFVCRGGQAIGYLSHLAIIDHELDLQPDRGPVESYRCGAFTEMVSEAWRGTAVSVKRVDAAAALREGCDRSLTSLLLNQAVREAKAIGPLRHPNILILMGISPTYHPQNTDLTLSLVFERCHLGSMYHHQHIKFERFSPVVALALLRQISEALLFVHHSGLVHCGLSSHAVHLVGPEVAKLGNFEYASPLGRRSPATSNVHPKALFNWMSPEAMQDESAAPAMDVYSFGTLACECFTGELPAMETDVHDVAGTWSPSFDRALLQGHHGIPNSLRKALQDALARSPRARPSLEQLRRLVVYEFWNFYDQLSSPAHKAARNSTSRPRVARARPSRAVQPESESEDELDELCVTSLDFLPGDERASPAERRTLASPHMSYGAPNTQSSSGNTTTSMNVCGAPDEESDQEIREACAKGVQQQRARTLSGSKGKPPLGSRRAYRRLAAVPKSPTRTSVGQRTSSLKVDLNVSAHKASLTRSSSEDELRMKPASHRVSLQPPCVNICDLTGTADLIRTASGRGRSLDRPSGPLSSLDRPSGPLSSLDRPGGPLSSLHAHSTPVETTTSTGTSFSPDATGQSMRSRARCFRSEVRVQLEMERSNDSHFPRVGDLIQRYEETDACVDTIRTRSRASEDSSSQTFPSMFLTAMDSQSATPDPKKEDMLAASPSEGASPLRQLLKDFPGCVVVLDEETARSLKGKDRKDLRSSAPESVRPKSSKKTVACQSICGNVDEISRHWGGPAQQTKVRGGKKKEEEPEPKEKRRSGEKSGRQSGEKAAGEAKPSKKAKAKPAASVETAEDPGSPELGWKDLEPVEPWEDVAPMEDAGPLDTTNHWEDGVEWPEETAPAPDDSFGTLTSFPSPEQALGHSFGEEEKIEGKKGQKGKKKAQESPTIVEGKKEKKEKQKPQESPNKENKKEKKEKQPKGASAGADAAEEGGWVQTALKMAKGSLEMLGRRSQSQEGEAKAEGGPKGTSPDAQDKARGKAEPKGGRSKAEKRADLARAHETKAALKEKFWNSNSNNEAPAEKAWGDRQEDAANTTWDLLEPSNAWEDDARAEGVPPFSDYNDVMTSKSALEDDETTTKDEDYKSCRLGSSLTTSPSDDVKQKRGGRVAKEAGETWSIDTLSGIADLPMSH